MGGCVYNYHNEHENRCPRHDSTVVGADSLSINASRARATLRKDRAYDGHCGSDQHLAR